MKNRPFHQRLRFALAGLHDGWRRERSFRTHSLFALVVFIGLLALRPAAVWWALVALAIALVMALELVNAALEAVIDHLHPDLHPEIRVAKDMAAGAVLLASIAALAIAAALAVSLL